MESPPQFAPSAPPPKKSNALLIIILIILGVCALCCVGIGIFSMNIYGKFKNGVGCVLHFTLARQALSSYAREHNNKLPDADTWQDEIIPYYGKEKTGEKANGGPFLDMGDPSKDLGCTADTGSLATGIAFNSDLAGKTVDEAKKAPTTVVLFEVPQVGRNISTPFKPQAGQSPNKIMGQLRDWITVPVSGAITGFGNTSGSSDSAGMNGL